MDRKESVMPPKKRKDNVEAGADGAPKAKKPRAPRRDAKQKPKPSHVPDEDMPRGRTQRRQQQPGQGPRTTSTTSSRTTPNRQIRQSLQGSSSPQTPPPREHVSQSRQPIAEDENRTTSVAGSNTPTSSIEKANRINAWLNSTTHQVSALPYREGVPTADPATRIADALERTLNTIRGQTLAGGSAQVAHRISYAKGLPPFSGDPLEWGYFKEAFRMWKERGAYDDKEIAVLLYGALKGDARESVKSLLVTCQDASVIMEVLELQYGNKNVVMKRILEDINDLPELHSSRTHLTRFATKLRGAVSSCKAIGMISQLQSFDLLAKIGNKLPSSLLYSYIQYAEQQGDKTSELEKLADFLYREAQRATATGLFAGAPIPSTSRDYTETSSNTTAAVVAHADTHETSNDHRQKLSPAKCPFCNRTNHRAFECRDFARESAERRWFLVKERGLCFKCLGTGHSRRNCRAKNRCATCKKRHHSLLHSSRTYDRGTNRVVNDDSREVRRRDADPNKGIQKETTHNL